MLSFFVFGASAAHADDKTIIRAMRAMQAGDWDDARTLALKSGDPLAKKIYIWFFLQKDAGDVPFSTVSAFLSKNESWPRMMPVRSAAEKSMPDDLGAAQVLAWFDRWPPETARGLDFYIDALLVSGRKDDAKKILEEWWIEKLSTRDDQRRIYMKYGALIGKNAHRRRLDNLLFSEQYSNARGIAGVLGPGMADLVEARIALAEEKPNAPALLSRVPAHLQSDPGLMFERLKWRRKNNLTEDAIAILNHAPPADQIQNPEDWWKEKAILIRRLMDSGQNARAAKLAAIHFQSEGQPYADAEWLAGWLALRYLKNPAEALQRFEAMHERVESPISLSRAGYWAGRAAEGMGNKALADEWYSRAAKFQTVYYGQLAGARIGIAQALPNARPPELSADDLARFNRDDLVRAAILFDRAGMPEYTDDFLKAFIAQEVSPKAYRFAAETAVKIGQPTEALKIAKDATRKGLFLTAQSYPVIADRLKNVSLEWALVHAIIRQESQFDSGALSPAGARGLMQLMPATAREISRKIGAPQDIGALTSNPSHNIRLGSAYLDSLLDRYDGAYPLAIAAYNAGPGNVDKWIETYGDPRDGKINLIDWVESIPFSETRNYVQRVLEAVYVYRLRLKNLQNRPGGAIHVAAVQ